MLGSCDTSWFIFRPQTVDVLLLNECGWNDETFSTLVCVLPTLARCSALVHLNLAGNRIGDVGKAAVRAAAPAGCSVHFFI